MGTSDSDVRTESIHRVLHQYWGFRTLRPLQREAIEASLAGHDSLVVLPTGGGKSLCYQVPAAVAGGLDVVVSPLISLMKDQVDGLVANGFPAAAIHSNLDEHERHCIRARLSAGELRLLFISPERLMTPGFAGYLGRLRVRAFAIDEAHCISHWGHDFRPEYRRLASLRDRFSGCSIHAFTATATPRVREDIAVQLQLHEPVTLVGVFDRPNLTYRIVPRVDPAGQTLEVIRRHDSEAIIVYCISRRETESLAAFLSHSGVRAAHYHAGMKPDDRRSVQERFSREQLDVVVATVAFGMGIDRSNVRAVVHAGMPKTIEAYQQETGRAGRDGLAAECVMLYSASDATRWTRLMEASAAEATAENPAAEESIAIALHAQLELLQHLRGFCVGTMCRHRRLSEYFGQSYAGNSCGACDVCLGEINGVEGSQTIARKILSCIARVDQRFGASHIADILVGARTQNIRSWGHEGLSTYGILKGAGKRAVTNFIHQLVDAGAARAAPPARPVLHLTELGREIMHDRRQISLAAPAAVQADAKVDEWEGVDRDLFETLCKWRREVAEARGLPPFVIFHDSTLRELARARPASVDLMRSIAGMSARKLEDWGAEICKLIEMHCRSTGLAMNQPLSAPSTTTSSKPVAMSRACTHFREGMSIAEVAKRLGRATSTVAGYLTDYIREERPASIEAWVSESVRQRVLIAAHASPDGRLKPIFDALGGEVSYDEIRFVLVHAEGADASESN